MEKSKGFFKTLFDLSFEKFITPRVIKLLFIFAIVVFGFIAFMTLMSGISILKYSVRGLILVAISPVIFIFGVISSRVSLELTIVLFSMESNVSEILKIKQQQSDNKN